MAAEIRRRWFDSNWGRTPSFALQLLDDETLRIGLVREVMASGRPARFGFIADLLREGATLPNDLLLEFVGELRAQAEREREGVEGDFPAADLLLALGQIPTTRMLIGEPFAV
jgi:hypothetical protein